MKRFVPKANPLRFALLGGAAVAAIGFLVAVALLLQNALYMVADEATRSDDIDCAGPRLVLQAPVFPAWQID